MSTNAKLVYYYIWQINVKHQQHQQKLINIHELSLLHVVSSQPDIFSHSSFILMSRKRGRERETQTQTDRERAQGFPTWEQLYTVQQPFILFTCVNSFNTPLLSSVTVLSVCQSQSLSLSLPLCLSQSTFTSFFTFLATSIG